jgi:hypothetical protein
MFASYALSTHFPPDFLNSDARQLPSSIEKMASLDPAGIIPNHYDFPDPPLHKQRFERLCSAVKRGRGRIN